MTIPPLECVINYGKQTLVGKFSHCEGGGCVEAAVSTVVLQCECVVCVGAAMYFKDAAISALRPKGVSMRPRNDR
jgi:hypothetical protein